MPGQCEWWKLHGIGVSRMDGSTIASASDICVKVVASTVDMMYNSGERLLLARTCSVCIIGGVRLMLEGV